jgi:hypothetical protein
VVQHKFIIPVEPDLIKVVEDAEAAALSDAEREREAEREQNEKLANREPGSQ